MQAGGSAERVDDAGTIQIGPASLGSDSRKSTPLPALALLAQYAPLAVFWGRNEFHLIRAPGHELCEAAVQSERERLLPPACQPKGRYF